MNPDGLFDTYIADIFNSPNFFERGLFKANRPVYSVLESAVGYIDGWVRIDRK